VGYPPGVSDRFASASEDGTIRLWDISEYKVLTRCLATSAGVPLCLNYRDEVLLSGWQDGKIRMFRSDSG
jgi:WD40 repeat protein